MGEPKDLARTSNDATVDERLCRNCGKCCYKKVIIGQGVYITPFPCEYLDETTNLCTIYHRRHVLNRSCLSVPDGMKRSAFPADCPYVAVHAPADYKPAREDRNWSAEWHDIDALGRDLGVSLRLRNLVQQRGPDARPLYAEVYEKTLAQRAASDGKQSGGRLSRMA